MVSLGTQPANRKSGFGHSSPTGARAQDLSRHPHARFEWGSYLQPCCFSARPRVGSTTSTCPPFLVAHQERTTSGPPVPSGIALFRPGRRSGRPPNCGPRRGRGSPQIAVLKSTKSPFSLEVSCGCCRRSGSGSGRWDRALPSRPPIWPSAKLRPAQGPRITSDRCTQIDEEPFFFRSFLRLL